jgi:hypothetical protein
MNKVVNLRQTSKTGNYASVKTKIYIFFEKVNKACKRYSRVLRWMQAPNNTRKPSTGFNLTAKFNNKSHE